MLPWQWARVYWTVAGSAVHSGNEHYMSSHVCTHPEEHGSGRLEMAVVSNGRSAMDSQVENQNGVVDRLKLLYPAVNEDKTPLPRAWSAKVKYNYIGLSQNNLRVHYKGHGKTHRDAASVQATHAIPAACGLYYFEVKIVSKGRDGYMGIGLSAQDVNMNRLPGWDKHSYGYHGDDGHSFCSSGTGQPYGPTFTTGDVIGCGVNLIDNTCFYTKNGHNLGTAFTDLPPNLYPTVGLQTPGEVVDANFGQEPFVFDIEDMMKELRARTRLSIHEFPVPESQGEWQAILHKMVSTYLVHHGYCATAESFAHVTGQPFNEDITSIRNRQRILKLVLAGRMGEAIEMTARLYPGLLEHNQNLLFMLKCRQFVEMVNGTDSEVCPRRCPPPTFCTSPPRPSSPIQQLLPTSVSVIQSTKTYTNSNNKSTKPCCFNNTTTTTTTTNTTNNIQELNNQNNISIIMNMNGTSGSSTTTPEQQQQQQQQTPVIRHDDDSDVEMDTSEEVQNQNGHNICCNNKTTTTTTTTTNGYQNGNSNCSNSSHKQQNIGGDADGGGEYKQDDDDEDMDIDIPICRKSCSKPAVEKILEFGRELYNMSQRLKIEQGKNQLNKKMLQDAFSLLAYSNPWASPVGWQLDPVQRESVCSSLNSAILESCNLPRRPPLEVAMAHAQELVRLMSSAGLGSCAFADVADLLEH